MWSAYRFCPVVLRKPIAFFVALSEPTVAFWGSTNSGTPRSSSGSAPGEIEVFTSWESSRVFSRHAILGDQMSAPSNPRLQRPAAASAAIVRDRIMLRTSAAAAEPPARWTA